MRRLMRVQTEDTPPSDVGGGYDWKKRSIAIATPFNRKERADGT
jgi:hypothetical protein